MEPDGARQIRFDEENEQGKVRSLGEGSEYSIPEEDLQASREVPLLGSGEKRHQRKGRM